MSGSDKPEGDLDVALRAADPDRWLSSRFVADLQARADVVAVYAFDVELARAPRVASNPLIAEMRLVWWREALEEAFGPGPVRRHLTAQALATAISRGSLPRAALEGMIDVRYRELDIAPLTDAERLELADGSGGASAVLAAQILDPAADAQAARAGGALWALRRAGGAPSPELIGAARAGARRLSARAFPAVAHASLTASGEFARRLQITWSVARGRI